MGEKLMAQRYTNMRDILYQIREGYSPKEIKMAIGIANDPRYKGGNYSGAVDQIEKIKKGLSQHKQVAAVLKRLNTDFDPEIVDEEVEIDEMKMDDPKLVKAFDKMKKGDTVKLKTSSTISKGKDFVDYVVTAKNVVNKGKVEKVTLVTKGNEKAVKKFLYKRDGKVTFAIGDMGASIDDIKEGKSSTGYELYHKDFSSAMAHAYDFAKKKFGIEVDPKEIDDKVASGPRKPSKGKTNSYRLKGKDGKKAIQVQVYGMDNGKYELNMYKEEVELDEMREPYAVVDTADGNKVVGTASDEKGAKSIITTSELPPMKIKDKKTLKIVKVKKKQMIGQPIKEEEEPNKPDSAKSVEQGRDDKKKTRIAQLQLQIAKATETINKLNAQEK
jgi:hypothetical protein